MMQPKPDQRGGQYKINSHEALNEAKKSFYKNEYPQSMQKCVRVIESILIELYLRLLSTAPTGEIRFNLVSLEMKIGAERHGIERFSVGKLVALCSEGNLLCLAENAFDIDIGVAKQIDLSSLVKIRNNAVHGGPNALSSESVGFFLFQTSTLFECLKIIIGDSETSNQPITHMSSAPEIDDLGYILVKLNALKEIRQELAEPIHKQCSEALEYARINPEDALFKLRKILEHISRQLFQTNIGDARQRPLDKLIITLREKGVIQNRILKHMEVIKGFGNRGAHPGGERYSLNDVEAVFLSLLVVIDWYFETEKAN